MGFFSNVLAAAGMGRKTDSEGYALYSQAEFSGMLDQHEKFHERMGEGKLLEIAGKWRVTGGADLQGRNLSMARFGQADLSDAKWDSKTEVSNAELQGAKINPQAVMDANVFLGTENPRKLPESLRAECDRQTTLVNQITDRMKGEAEVAQVPAKPLLMTPERSRAESEIASGKEAKIRGAAIEEAKQKIASGAARPGQSTGMSEAVKAAAQAATRSMEKQTMVTAASPTPPAQVVGKGQGKDTGGRGGLG